MAKPPPGPLDDIYNSILITDFQGGLVTQTSPLALSSNQSPAMLNVLHLPGRLMFRGGYSNTCTLPAGADAAWPFYDSNGGKHFMVWAGGNVYDCVTGVAVVVETGVYTAGQRIGTCDLNGVLYWSSGKPNPVPLRFWDPASATKGAVASSGVVGSVAPPASDFLFLYLNSIVALAPTWGSPVVYQPNVFCWCNTNDPSTWIAANSQSVGPNNNGRVEFGIVFGIAESGVPPYENIIIGRNDFGVFAYSGALGSLHEGLLNCPAGVKDRGSVQYLPTAGDFGTIVWLGTDGQVWSTNGINAKPISEPILPTLSAAFNAALGSNTNARFFSGYNQTWQYYWLDINGTQFVYRWASNSWTLFQGWPTGPSFASVDGSGRPAYYVASNATVGAKLAQIAQAGISDNGVMPSVYWSSPILHGGNFDIFKDFQWAAIATFDTGAQYKMTGVSIKRQDGSQMTANDVTLVSPSVSSGTPFTLGVSILGGPDVLTSVAPGGSGTPVVMQGRFAVPIPESEFQEAGHFETLKGNGMQLTISYAGGANAFDLLGVEVLYVPKGYRRGAGTLYNPEAVTNQPFDPWGAPTS